MHYAFGDRVIAVDYAVAPGLRLPSFPRKKSDLDRWKGVIT